MSAEDEVLAPGVEGFAERIFTAALGSMEMQSMYLGERLGWYRALAEAGPLNARELADRTGCDARYAREWLEHQAVIGYLVLADDQPLDPAQGPAQESPQEPAQGPTEEPAHRRFSLPEAHAEVLTDPDSMAYLSPMSWLLAATSHALPDLLTAFRTGGGVSWQQLGADARQAQAALNRPMFLNEFTQTLLPSIPDVHARLQAGARVADIGCGEGWSSIGLALGYPAVTVDGFDVDTPSVEAALGHARAAGVADRVSVHEADATAQGLPGAIGAANSYDVVLAIECVHDLPDPVGVLRAMRRMVRPDGAVIVVDELTADHFSAPAGMTEQLFYGYSVLCCLADGMSHPGSAATGTVMRPDTLRQYARDAGFEGVEVLPVDHELFRFYRLR